MHQSESSTAWGAVVAISVSVAVLITAELLPVCLLTPMARELKITEGVAGQTLTATALTAIASSLMAPTLLRSLDRKLVVMSFSLLLILSSLLAVFSSQFALVLLGRVLLGLALGAFWALSASLALRLARPADVPRALSLLFGGVSVALVLAAPAGSLLEGVVGWRGVFALTALLGACCLLGQALALPRIPAISSQTAAGKPWRVLARPGVPVAMLANFTVFAGQFAIFSYIRPFFEQITHLNPSGISAVLLLFGLTNFAGTLVSSPLLNYSFRATLGLPPLVITLCAVGLCLFGQNVVVTSLLIAVWGCAFGLVPVSWSAWVTRRLSDDAENAGGMQVATIQAANTMGAAVGGWIFDLAGPRSPMILGAFILAATSALIFKLVPTRFDENHLQNPSST